MNKVTIIINDSKVSHHLFTDNNLKNLNELLELIDLVCKSKALDQCQHSNKHRYTDHFRCEDCGKNFNQGTLEYFLLEGASSIKLAIHNRGVDCIRAGQILEKELENLQEELQKKNLLSLSKEAAEELFKKTYKILSRYKMADERQLIK